MDNKKKIAIVDDDRNIAELIQLYLEKDGYETLIYSGGKALLDEFGELTPDLILLDIMLPEIDGLEVLKALRKMSNVPVVMLTAKGETFDKVLGLELGADDYLVKPFDGKELLARVKAVLRRSSGVTNTHSAIVHKNIAIDLEEYTVVYHGTRLDFPPKELELLYFLASHADRVFTREQLLEQIWGYDYFGDSRTVDVHMKRIREKFTKEDPWELKTVWGVGYKFSTKK